MSPAPDFQQNWLKLHGAVPSWLYHYTTAEGLLGILHERSIFGTHYRYLSDSLEIAWGKQLVAQHIDRYIERVEQPLKVALSIFQGAPLEQYWDIYVACFCAHDNLLSQWRCYGKSGGYALAFKGVELGLSQLPERHLRRVIYDNAEQDQWARLALDWFVNKIETIRRDGDPAQSHSALNEAAGLMWRHLCEMCVSFKLEVFKEESEWRIVEFVPKKESVSSVDKLTFRSKGGMLIPCRLFPTERIAEAKPIQPLDGVVCGPTISREEAEDSVRMFLRSANYAGVWVNSSMIPINAALELR